MEKAGVGAEGEFDIKSQLHVFLTCMTLPRPSTPPAFARAHTEIRTGCGSAVSAATELI